MFAIILAKLLKFLSNDKSSIINNLENILRTLTNQSLENFEDILLNYNSVNNIQNNNNTKYAKLSHNSLFMLWILSASILTKCFSSVLLGIYSTQKSVPLVDSLDD